MNPNKADSQIPVVITTSLDLPPLWGRLAALSPTEAELVSHFELPAGKMVALAFDLGGAGFEDMRARIKTAARDADGYYNYELAFVDPAQAALLKSAIARAAPR
ncbi:MAG TPA: hypothetical protein DCW72_02215 [Elusimicrobia bacterium]|nr:MAG: hypothetical protein A2X29_00340 [Elusimicrobia bacterium GWA2_64_40]OGR63760.1 MAG: hypothetical protein A2X30_09060 [Elusimicrobia bacterium GWB2_63_16]HAN05495.1 hypothetical protein [Elusimicrobiota bacterium]HAU89070.1 hypothetical protein [Elusimicrobiota bacterium]